MIKITLLSAMILMGISAVGSAQEITRKQDAKGKTPAPDFIKVEVKGTVGIADTWYTLTVKKQGNDGDADVRFKILMTEDKVTARLLDALKGKEVVVQGHLAPFHRDRDPNELMLRIMKIDEEK